MRDDAWIAKNRHEGEESPVADTPAETDEARRILTADDFPPFEDEVDVSVEEAMAARARQSACPLSVELDLMDLPRSAVLA